MPTLRTPYSLSARIPRLPASGNRSTQRRKQTSTASTKSAKPRKAHQVLAPLPPNPPRSLPQANAWQSQARRPSSVSRSPRFSLSADGGSTLLPSAAAGFGCRGRRGGRGEAELSAGATVVAVVRLSVTKIIRFFFAGRKGAGRSTLRAVSPGGGKVACVGFGFPEALKYLNVISTYVSSEPVAIGLG